ncbi:MAG: hypothetical protein NHB32_14290 [Fischerella sp. CENA71]|nr:hypothetical protein [Fischerella sp. CENA71]
MSKRVVIRTQTLEADGTITATERVEESSSSGLLEAWGFFALILFTFLLFLVTYRVVSSITYNQPTFKETFNYGIQERF